MPRYALEIEYIGTKYCGFQRQSHENECNKANLINKNITKKPSIAAKIEEAIFLLSQEKVKITASARTDAGVHCKMQIIHFDLAKNFAPNKVQTALNYHLKNEEISILSSKIVEQNFNARFNAKQRIYCYHITNRKGKILFEKSFSWHIPTKINLEKMQQASNIILTSQNLLFFLLNCERKLPQNLAKVQKINLDYIKISQKNCQIFVEIAARSFFRHLVRAIIGALIYCATNKMTIEELQIMLKTANRSKACALAPACGLFLIKVNY